jgi:hypothetical protein
LSESKISVGTQLAALFLASAAVLWGIAAACSIAFPGPSGEWAVLAVYASYVVNVPVGLTALAVRGATLLFCVAEFISERAMTARPSES